MAEETNPMQKFYDIPVGGKFSVHGEVMKKTGSLTYESLSTGELGERSIEPIIAKVMVVLEENNVQA
jgi:hypothetical protein